MADDMSRSQRRMLARLDRITTVLAYLVASVSAVTAVAFGWFGDQLAATAFLVATGISVAVSQWHPADADETELY